MERPERIVLFILGALFNRMAPVLWIIAVLANITVIHRMIFTWQQTRSPQPTAHNPQPTT
jgi:CDP-diacylglycerol--glycerol-3-phosphate 3-phosphatidyltransferase